MENITDFKNELLTKLIVLRTKIARNSFDAWEGNLEDTKWVAILEDFEIAVDEDEYETQKYNGWANDLDSIIDSLSN